MKRLLVSFTLFCALATSAMAQEAPAPRKMPRTPVNRQQVVHPATPPSRDIQGLPTILDGEKLKLNGFDLRLFGIVPPQLSASYGPQARTALDSIVGGQAVTCHIRDRDHEGRLLATCQSSSGKDIAAELLQRGLAVTARGSLSDSELAPAYIAAEEGAQAAHSGLWSMLLPAASTPSAVVPVTVPPAVAPEPVKLEAPKLIETPVIISAAVTKRDEPKKEDVKPDHKAVSVPVMTSDPMMAVPVTSLPTSGGFFARFQILIGGALMLMTALGVLTALSWQRRREQKDELMALAAALRGELLAARAVCQTRLRQIASDADEKAIAWPRLRSTLYQAYVGRLGWLGAELARQIASIYGQANDYASYYNNMAPDDGHAPKKQALHNLVNYIDEVLPRLEHIESTGRRPAVTKSANAKVQTKLSAKPMAAAVPVFPSAANTSPSAGHAGEDEADHFVGLWDSLRNFARSHTQPQHQSHVAEHFSPHASEEADMADYVTLVERDIANQPPQDDPDEHLFGIRKKF
jgi:hypothetical protein